MSDNIKIGKVEVVSVFKTKVQAVPSVTDPDAAAPVKEVTASKLQIIQHDPNDVWSLRGDLHVPLVLPFGKVYDLMLVEHVEEAPLSGNARKFQETEIIEPEPLLEVGEPL